MTINASKTELMHIREQGQVSRATVAECKKVAKHECPHIGCTKVFLNVHGCKVHAGKCRRGKLYIVDKLLAVEGETGSADRRFLVQWQGYGPEHNGWQPRNNLPPKVVNDYLRANNLYDYNWTGGRCAYCDRPCKSSQNTRKGLLAKTNCSKLPRHLCGTKG